MTLFKVLRTAFVILVACVPLTAQPNDKDLRLLAEGGDREAQYRLSTLEGVPLSESMRWLRLSAEQGYTPAQMAMGNRFYSGMGAIPQDLVEALKWYRRAAEQGSARGQNAVGNMYFDGYGVEQDDREAVRWYRLAAQKGDPRAQTMLGYAYQEGFGVERNDLEAEKWYRKALKQGHAAAREGLVLQYLRGRAVPERGESVLELFEKMEEEGDPQMLASIATVVSLAGRFGMPRDVESAMRIVKDAHLKNEDIVYWFTDLYLRDLYLMETSDAAKLQGDLKIALDEGKGRMDAFLKEFDAAVPVH